MLKDLVPEDIEETYKGKRTDKGAPGTLKAKITKLYGGPVTIEKARKLKDRANATTHDKQQANWFINFHSKNENIEPQEYNRKDELQPYIDELTQYMVDQGLSIEPLPDLKYVDDESNAENILGTTGYYDPNTKCITLYVTKRHPKDILRSFAHEMIHHYQNMEERLNGVGQTTDINEDDRLREIEREAYELGNMLFRGWENSRKQASCDCEEI